MSIIYHGIIRFADQFVPSRLQPLWNHPAGPKTIFFWSPLFKWGLVIAGLGDIKRPAENISIPQAGALTATGLIWSRYSLVIIPKNWSLFSVNVFVCLTGLYSLSRAVNYRYFQKPEIQAVGIAPENTSGISAEKTTETTGEKLSRAS